MFVCIGLVCGWRVLGLVVSGSDLLYVVVSGSPIFVYYIPIRWYDVSLRKTLYFMCVLIMLHDLWSILSGQKSHGNPGLLID